MKVMNQISVQIAISRSDDPNGYLNDSPGNPSQLPAPPSCIVAHVTDN